MKYIAAYLLAQVAGKDEPAKADVKKIVSASGAEYDDDRASKLFAALEGKTVADLIEEGKKKLASCGGGGGGGGGAAAAPAGGDAKKEAAAPPPKEESEEEDTDFGLFD
eukprot:Hpha_TRINITY_DN16283_c4_g2::TRINITY_DN16283_c4_g2_i2::g.16315::m.16315/K02943/RP-LP2, RPLP2; large subunit ribosomal protein LP2